MSKPYDATKEFAPFQRSENYNGRHPRTRTGATAKRATRRLKMASKPVVVAPQNGKKK